MYSLINLFWKDPWQDSILMFLDCMSNENISRSLSGEEISMALDFARAAVASKTFTELGKALKVSSDRIAEMLEIPADVIADWNVNGLPEYLKKMITVAIISRHIDNSRVHTCHKCGKTFVSRDSKEIMCENCKYKMSAGILDRYIQFRIHGSNN